MEQKIGNSNSRIVAIITMCFIFAMISFVTNMGAPFGNIWGFKYTWASMMGNMMNFAAYLFMGIPAGKQGLQEDSPHRSCRRYHRLAHPIYVKPLR